MHCELCVCVCVCVCVWTLYTVCDRGKSGPWVENKEWHVCVEAQLVFCLPLYSCSVHLSPALSHVFFHILFSVALSFPPQLFATLRSLLLVSFPFVSLFAFCVTVSLFSWLQCTISGLSGSLNISLLCIHFPSVCSSEGICTCSVFVACEHMCLCFV